MKLPKCLGVYDAANHIPVLSCALSSRGDSRISWNEAVSELELDPDLWFGPSISNSVGL